MNIANHWLTSMFNKDTPKYETRVSCVGRVSTRHGRLKSALRHALFVGCGRCFTLRRCFTLTSMFNKDTPKYETRVSCVGRVLTRHGRLKSALRHAILVGCGRCFTLKNSCAPNVHVQQGHPKACNTRVLRRAGFNPPWPTKVGPTTSHFSRLSWFFRLKSWS